jgi:hypothetical protein
VSNGAPCPVCDPWAAPSGAVAAPAAFAAIPQPSKVPSWISRTAGRNPPAYADLEKAWRNTVIVGSLTVVFMVFAMGAVMAGLWLRSAGLGVACAGVAVLALVGVLGVGLVVRRQFWLGRAVAVVGTRPDIGYEGFARIRGIAWMTRGLLAMRVLTIGYFVLNIWLTGLHTMTALNVSFAVYALVLTGLCALQYAAQASARREFARMLAR